MPVLVGATVLLRLRERLPALPCCLMTAYDLGPLVNRFGATVALLAKPFDLDSFRWELEMLPGRHDEAGDDRRTRCA